jgi:hypothetical protein
MLRADHDSRGMVNAVPVRFMIWRPIFVLGARRAQAEALDAKARSQDAEPGVYGASSFASHVAAQFFMPLRRYERRVEREHGVVID